MKTIFFDFGNVIGFFDHGRALQHFARYTDTPHAELETLLYGGTLGDDYDSGRITTHEYLAHVKTLANFRCTDDEFLAAYTDIFWPNPDVCELIPTLAKTYRLVLASNTNDAHYQQFTKTFAPVLGHLHHLVASHVVGARKPRPEFYQRAQEWAHAEPHECVFVDDLPKNVAAAVAHGWTGVLYQTGDRLADKLRAAGVPVE